MRRRGLWRDRDGAAALEFALLAPAFLALVFGVIGFGLAFWTQAGLQHGAEMAARCASIDSVKCPTGNPAAIADYALSQAYGLNLPASTFNYSAPACGNEVDASYTFALPQILNLAPVTLTAKACFPA